MRYKKVSIEELIPQLEPFQFLELCKICGVEVLDKAELRQGLGVEGEPNTETISKLEVKIDESHIKVRRDFDLMEQELIEAYHKFPRKTRRKMEYYFARIYWGNKTARKAAAQPEAQD